MTGSPVQGMKVASITRMMIESGTQLSPEGERQTYAIVDRSLEALSRLGDPVQWLFVDAARALVLRCAGEGPFASEAPVPQPLCMEPRPCHGGWLTGMLFSDSGDDPTQQHALAFWIPGHGNPHNAGLRGMLYAQGKQIEQLFHYQHQCRQLRGQLRSSRDEATHDLLTGLYNSRGWAEIMEQEEVRSCRYGNVCTLVVLDLDGLKRLNDDQGHQAGDALIRTTARILGENTRETDFAARVGGDEFAILLVETDEARAGRFLQRLEGALKRAGIRGSLGSAQRRPGESLSDTLYRADQAMYVSKRDRQAGAEVQVPARD